MMFGNGQVGKENAGKTVRMKESFELVEAHVGLDWFCLFLF